MYTAVRYNRVYVITKTVITKFYCSLQYCLTAKSPLYLTFPFQIKPFQHSDLPDLFRAQFSLEEVNVPTGLDADIYLNSICTSCR